MENIHPKYDGMVTRAEKEAALGQRAQVIWLYGLSGAGKSTLGMALERCLAAEGRMTVLLDGDNLRAGLNRGLGFSDVDRSENIRRVAEVAKLFVQSGTIAICAFITPLKVHRQMVRDIVGEQDLLQVYLSASLAACERRDPKGLYAKAAQGGVKQFTGKDSEFESPPPGEDIMVLDSEHATVEATLDRLHAFVRPHIIPR